MHDRESSSPWAGALIEQNRQWLTPYLHSLVGDREAARDLTQEVFLTALRNQDKFDGRRPLGAWLRGIAKNIAHEYRRKAKRLPVVVDAEALERLDEYASVWESHCAEPDFAVMRVKALNECLLVLTARIREIFRLKYAEYLDSKTIGQRLEMQVGAVNMALSRGRKALAECIAGKVGCLTHE